MEYKIVTPKNVNFIIKLLERGGFGAFAVGGCVRDALMGREPEDWDITTSAAPMDIKGIFRRTIDTGIQHGTVTVMLDRVGYEVTTYRIDGSYSDGRHPDEVLFTKNLVEDLKRRDFTINAMAYNDRIGIVDEFNGISDLKNKCIKCVGNPVERFTEDALRMIRAVRFAAKLGFDIEENTAAAIKEMAPSIKRVSKERIRVELDKLISSDNPGVLKMIKELDLDKYILDTSVLIGDNGKMYNTIIAVMEKLAPISYFRWSAFMMFEGDKCKEVLRKLKFDNKTINICSKLVENQNYFDGNYAELSKNDKKYVIRRLLVSIGPDVFEEYYMPFMRGLQQAGAFFDDVITAEMLDEIESLYNEIIADGDCIVKEKMALRGNDLKELGVEPGKVMGEVINRMFEEVLRNPGMNDRDKLIEFVEDSKSDSF